MEEELPERYEAALKRLFSTYSSVDLKGKEEIIGALEKLVKQPAKKEKRNCLSNPSKLSSDYLQDFDPSLNAEIRSIWANAKKDKINQLLKRKGKTYEQMAAEINIPLYRLKKTLVEITGNKPTQGNHAVRIAHWLYNHGYK